MCLRIEVKYDVLSDIVFLITIVVRAVDMI